MMAISELNQHWLVVGHETTNEAANIGRCVDDGVLLCVRACVAGRLLTTLIDLGASRCYMNPTTATHCDLKLEKGKLYLLLANGAKILSTQKASNMYCQVGKSMCKVSFIVTKLLHNAYLVLGINWLSQ